LRSFQDASEARPDPFIIYDYPRYLDQSREAMAKLLNTPSSTLVFVPNATTGVNTVLRNLTFQPGDHILMFSTIYGACEKTVQYITETTAAKSVKVAYTYPVEDEWLVEEFRRKVKEVEDQGGRVKIAIYDIVVSMPGVRAPFERLTQVCKELGVMSCIDGAHGVGHVELDLGTLDPDFFISNCHKYVPPHPDLSKAILEAGIFLLETKSTNMNIKMALRPPRLRNLPRCPTRPTPNPQHTCHIPRLHPARLKIHFALPKTLLLRTPPRHRAKLVRTIRLPQTTTHPHGKIPLHRKLRIRRHYR
jgi:hypothetical protein